MSEPTKVNTEDIIQRLSKLALEFNNGNGSEIPSCEENLDPQKIACKNLEKNNDIWIEFDCDVFYNFIGQDVSKDNVGKLLCHMRDSIENSMEVKKVNGSTTELRKVQSLKGRWFRVKMANVEKMDDWNTITRDDIYFRDECYYRVLSVYKKSYNKWRLESTGSKKEKMKIHLQLLEKYHGSYHAHQNYEYVCINSKEIGDYVGHAFAINK